jgi:hypothetical protein
MLLATSGVRMVVVAHLAVQTDSSIEAIGHQRQHQAAQSRALMAAYRAPAPAKDQAPTTQEVVGSKKAARTTKEKVQIRSHKEPHNARKQHTPPD